MSFGNISIWQLLILLLIVVLVFGTKKLRGMGGDLGSAIRDFRKGMSDNDNDESASGEKSVSVEESDDTASATKNTSDSSETRT